MARPITSVLNREQGGWISPNRSNLDQRTESRRARRRLESRRAQEGLFDSSEFTDQIQREVEGNSEKFPN